MDEHILCAAIRSDKTEAFVAVKPLHSSLRHTFQLLSFRMDVRKTSCSKVARAITVQRARCSVDVECLVANMIPGRCRRRDHSHLEVKESSMDRRNSSTHRLAATPISLTKACST